MRSSLTHYLPCATSGNSGASTETAEGSRPPSVGVEGTRAWCQAAANTTGWWHHPALEKANEILTILLFSLRTDKKVTSDVSSSSATSQDKEGKVSQPFFPYKTLQHILLPSMVNPVRGPQDGRVTSMSASSVSSPPGYKPHSSYSH